MALRSLSFMSFGITRGGMVSCAVGALLFSTALITPHVALAQEDSAAARLSRMEAQMDTLSRAVFKGDVPASAMPSPVAATPSASYQASVETRLSDLEKQLRDLTGKVEQSNFENTQLKARLDKALADIELRFQDQSAGGAGIGSQSASSMGHIAGQDGAAIPQQTGPVDDMTSDVPPKQSGTLAPQDMGGPVLSAPSQAPVTAPAVPITTLPSVKDKNAPAPADSPTIKQLGTLNEAPGGASISQEPSKDATAQYEMAFSQLKSGNYAGARTGFEAFLKTSPTHPLASNATYWLGESYYGQGDYEKAARVFAESYKKYPQGPKVADSLLKMGMALGAGGKKKEACVTLQQLKKEFPTGQGVTLRRAEQEMSKLGCNS